MRTLNVAKSATVIAAVLLLAACSSTPAPTAATGGAGNAPPPQVASNAPTSNVTPGSADDFKVNVGDRIFFDYDKYDLSAEARAQLDKQAAWLKAYPNITVTVEGNCDERGTREYNLALGERRATSAKNYLVALGVDPNRVQTISYGKERPAVLGSDESAWAQNRRDVTGIN
jgi:peptidoglycan-associated lipoprotein